MHHESENCVTTENLIKTIVTPALQKAVAFHTSSRPLDVARRKPALIAKWSGVVLLSRGTQCSPGMGIEFSPPGSRLSLFRAKEARIVTRCWPKELY